MLKPLTLSISLALALGASSISFAGHLGHAEPCNTCGLASAQGPVASAQSVIATGGCEAPVACSPKKKCGLGLGGLMSKLHQPKVYTYEWVLKKKKVKHHAPSCGGCDTCSAAPSVYPSAQYASPQGGGVAPSGQIAPSGQVSSTGQIRTGYLAPATGDVPPPPAVTASPLFLSPAGN